MTKIGNRKNLCRAALTLVLLACAALSLNSRVAFGTVALAGYAATDDCKDECQEDLNAAQAATAQYHNEGKALADGFFSTQHCVQVPGLGGMGVHYVNPGRMDLNVDAASPEVLLYVGQNDGTMRLIGVEYLVPVIVNGSPWFGPGPPPNGQYNAAPVLFGRAFDGPMAGHGPGEPWHYDMHVWAWRNNPRGLFFPFNPNVSCD